MNYYHEPVLLKESLLYLNPKPHQNFIDCTVGMGGHAVSILKKSSPDGKLLCIDQDPEGLNEVKNRLSAFTGRTVYACDNFRNISEIVRDTKFPQVSGIIFDLGIASWQLGSKEKGLSFSNNSYLDMRLNPKLNITAADILNDYSEKQLSNLFYIYGDIRNNRSLARRIISGRKDKPINRSNDLIEVVGTKNPKMLAPVFQALRIEVNHELENLQIAIQNAMELLLCGGRIVVISYHSGEDRIVKNFFRSDKSRIRILTKKPIIPDSQEINMNSRSRSAKLRAAEKI